MKVVVCPVALFSEMYDQEVVILSADISKRNQIQSA